MCEPSLSRGYELAAEWRHFLPLMSICNPPIYDIWYLIIILYVAVSIYSLSVHYSQKSGMHTYTHEILVVIGTVIISAQLLETVFFGKSIFFNKSWPDVVTSLPGWPIPTIWPTSRRMWCSISWATDRFLSRARSANGVCWFDVSGSRSCDFDPNFSKDLLEA